MDIFGDNEIVEDPDTYFPTISHQLTPDYGFVDVENEKNRLLINELTLSYNSLRISDSHYTTEYREKEFI